MNRALRFSLALLLPLTPSLAAATGAPAILQPVEGRQGVLFVWDGERGWAMAPDGRATTLPLRAGESLSAVAETADGWVAAGVRAAGDEHRLFLLEHAAGTTRRLPLPRRSGAALQLRPQPLVDAGSLVGLAWLEGDDVRRLGVAAAAWTGSQWEAAHAVAPPGRGSQTGLSAAVLEDGSWMLVWSAFDGRDDEIVWSERRGGEWTSPRRLHAANGVPDVTPALVAAEGGMLAAWSRLDDGGEYRIALARYDGSRWSGERRVGAAGTLYPSFTRQQGRSYLLYRNAAPRGWTVLELAADGGVTRRAVSANPSGARPAVEAPGAAGVELRWPGDDAPATASWEAVR